ncbi:MAG: hypothetical protein U5K69_13550 [Balneolaceae bacterium]|nr:hypothetical protein [Balneolaceae bacterium]
MPDALGQLYSDHGSGYRAAATAFNLSITFLADLVVGVGRNRCRLCEVVSHLRAKGEVCSLK